MELCYNPFYRYAPNSRSVEPPDPVGAIGGAFVLGDLFNYTGFTLPGEINIAAPVLIPLIKRSTSMFSFGA